PAILRAVEASATRAGFSVARVTLEVQGICDACAKKAA
ncbi:MAG: transcriptional repressor, partial [Rhodospirillaceae bacterium]|nr:transcriptional repressor [Rhodospirillaceae bacterium]